MGYPLPCPGPRSGRVFLGVSDWGSVRRADHEGSEHHGAEGERRVTRGAPYVTYLRYGRTRHLQRARHGQTTQTGVSILQGVCGVWEGQTTQTGVSILLGVCGVWEGQTTQTGVSILLGVCSVWEGQTTQTGVWCSTWTDYPDSGEYPTGDPRERQLCLDWCIELRIVEVKDGNLLLTVMVELYWSESENSLWSLSLLIATQCKHTTEKSMYPFHAISLSLSLQYNSTLNVQMKQKEPWFYWLHTCWARHQARSYSSRIRSRWMWSSWQRCCFPPINGLFTLHRIWTGTGNKTGTIGGNAFGSCHCLEPLWTFLYNI